MLGVVPPLLMRDVSPFAVVMGCLLNIGWQASAGVLLCAFTIAGTMSPFALALVCAAGLLLPPQGDHVRLPCQQTCRAAHPPARHPPAGYLKPHTLQHQCTGATSVCCAGSAARQDSRAQHSCRGARQQDRRLQGEQAPSAYRLGQTHPASQCRQVFCSRDFLILHRCCVVPIAKQAGDGNLPNWQAMAKGLGCFANMAKTAQGLSASAVFRPRAWWQRVVSSSSCACRAKAKEVHKQAKVRLQQVEELTMHNAHLEGTAAELAALLQVKLMRSCSCSAHLRLNVYDALWSSFGGAPAGSHTSRSLPAFV